MDFEWLRYPVAFIVILGIVVTIHEFGHFFMARLFGVKVLRFAVGFGKPLYRWQGTSDTEFCICAIPLGGYVRLLDSRQDDIAPAEKDQDLSAKSVGARISVYAAGPLINLLFAVLVFSVYASLGVTEARPVIGVVESESIAQQAGLRSGDEIVAVQGRVVRSWEEVSFQFVERAGLTGNLELTVQPEALATTVAQIEESTESSDSSILSDSPTVKVVQLPVSRFMTQSGESPLRSLGILPKIQMLPAKIGLIADSSPAQRAGWQVGDLIVSLNDQPIDYWQNLYDYVRAKPNQDIQFKLQRDGQILEGVIQTEAMDAAKSKTPGTAPAESQVGRIGAGPEMVEPDPALLREVHYAPWSAFIYGLEQTWVRMRLVVLAIGKLFSGALALDNVTGPVTIAEIAGKSTAIGVSSSLNFIAYLSVSLGIFNLLPVPMLDGGHIAFALCEKIRGRPLSLKTQQKSMMIGVILLGSLMMLAFFNDFVRLLN